MKKIFMLVIGIVCLMSSFSIVSNAQTSTSYASRMELHPHWNDCENGYRYGDMIITIPSTPAGYTTEGWQFPSYTLEGVFGHCWKQSLTAITGSLTDVSRDYTGFNVFKSIGVCYSGTGQCSGTQKDGICYTVLGVCFPAFIQTGDTVSVSIQLWYGAYPESVSGVCVQVGTYSGQCTINA